MSPPAGAAAEWRPCSRSAVFSANCAIATFVFSSGSKVTFPVVPDEGEEEEEEEEEEHEEEEDEKWKCA